LTNYSRPSRTRSYMAMQW